MSDLSVKLKPEVLGKSELAILASFEDLHLAMRDVKMSGFEIGHLSWIRPGWGDTVL